ncbi:MAG: Hpt domain-containing protein [Treponema sp.]|nr:Hpt domain-containing protein [Treponema sp.]
MNEDTELNAFESFAIEGIDLQRGMLNFTPKIYCEVLRVWCKHIQTSVEKLRRLAQAIEEGDNLNEYVIAVHGLKGSSYGICADEIGKRAGALESAGRRGDVAFVLANNEPLAEEIQALHARLSAVLDTCVEKNKDKPTAAAPDAGLLAELLAACRNFHTNAVDEALKKLEAFNYEAGGALVQWLRDQIDNLEYEAVERRLAEELAPRAG